MALIILPCIFIANNPSFFRSMICAVSVIFVFTTCSLPWVSCLSIQECQASCVQKVRYMLRLHLTCVQIVVFSLESDHKSLHNQLQNGLRVARFNFMTQK